MLIFCPSTVYTLAVTGASTLCCSRPELEAVKPPAGICIHRSGAPDVLASPEPMFPFIAEEVYVGPSASLR